VSSAIAWLIGIRIGTWVSPPKSDRKPIRQDGCSGRIIEADKTKNSLSSPLDFAQKTDYGSYLS
jgi:hypothetical protein